MNIAKNKPRKMGADEFIKKAEENPNLVAKWPRRERRRLDVLIRRNKKAKKTA